MAQKTRIELNALYPDNANREISEADIRELVSSNFNLSDDTTDEITEGDNKFVSATEKAKITTNETSVSNHTSNTSNPHSVTKTQVGLSNVDNTADTDKPISAATQLALDDKASLAHDHDIADITNLQTTLDTKLESADIADFETTTELNSRDTNNRSRANHTGTQLASTISNFDTEVSNNTDVDANTTARHTHANKALLDTYDQTNANLSDAVTKKHTQNTDTILDEGGANEITAATIKAHIETASGNPHSVTKSDVGLGNVDNTSDANKPISNATQTALDDKLEAADIANFETSSQLNTRDTNNRNRANHTGTQTASTISDFAATVEANSEVKHVVLGFAVGDETTELTVGTAKITFRMPYAMTLTAVRANVKTAPTGSTLIIDINESGTAILSTKLSIDATEKTSETATAAVISDSALADDAEITVDIDQVGATFGGAGLKIWLIGTRT